MPVVRIEASPPLPIFASAGRTRATPMSMATSTAMTSSSSTRTRDRSAVAYAGGDFDFNARVDADDYFQIDSNYNKASLSPAATAALPSASFGAVYRRPDDVLNLL